MNSPTATRRHAGERSGSKPFGNGAKAALLAAAFFLVPVSAFASEEHLKFTVTPDNRLEISRVPAAYSNLNAYSAGVADSSGVGVYRQVLADISKNASKLPYSLRDNIKLSPSVLKAGALRVLTSNPYSIVGSILGGYLIDLGLNYISSNWTKLADDPNVDTVNYQYWDVNVAVNNTAKGYSLESACADYVVRQNALLVGGPYQNSAYSLNGVTYYTSTQGYCNYKWSQTGLTYQQVAYQRNPTKPVKPKSAVPATAADLSAALDSIVSQAAKLKGVFDSIKTQPIDVPPTAPAQFDLPADDLQTIDQPETTTVTNPDGTTQTKTKTKALSTTSTQTGTTVADNTASVTQKTIETTTGPAGQTETKVTPVVQTPPKTVDDSPTPEASPINCKMLNNCDWTKETTLQEIKNGVGVTQPTEATDKKPAIQATDDLAKSQIEQFAKPDTPFDDWFNFMPHYTCVNPKLGNGVMSWTVPICDHIGMMQEVMNFLWTLTAIITNIYLFFSRKPNE